MVLVPSVHLTFYANVTKLSPEPPFMNLKYNHPKNGVNPMNRKSSQNDDDVLICIILRQPVTMKSTRGKYRAKIPLICGKTHSVGLACTAATDRADTTPRMPNSYNTQKREEKGTVK